MGFWTVVTELQKVQGSKNLGVTNCEVRWSEVKWWDDLWWNTCIITDLYSVIQKDYSISYVYISWTIHDMWMIYITFERRGTKFSNTTARELA